MALSESEKINLQRQIRDLEEKIQAEKNASDGLVSKETEAGENDAVLKKQWLYFHQIILNYEKEIEKLNGQYISSPFSEADLEAQARETGRLYQAPASQDPKTIPEMTGGGLAASPRSEHEGTLDTILDHLITTFLSGEDGGPAFTPTVLDEAYTAGDEEIITTDTLDPNKWYLLGKDTLVKVGSVTGSGPGPYTGTITERYFLSGLDVNVPANGTVTTWPGYSNGERTTKVATSTTQRFFNVLLAHLQDYFGRFRIYINDQLSLLNKNPDPDKSQVAIETNEDFLDRIDAYISDGYRLNDGSPGIAVLQLILSDRTTYRLARPAQAITAKSAYYASRINMTRLRVNIQSGTLTRVKFLGTVRQLTPKGGDPALQKTLKSLKALLQS